MQLRPPLCRLLELPEQRSARAALADLRDALVDPSERSAPPAQPLFLHGPTGCGKSALVSALIEELGEFIAPPTVCVFAASDTPQADDAERRKEARQADLLVIEDVQRVPAWAHEPLVQLLDARSRRRAAVVLTANAGPRHLTHRGTSLPARLTTRLAGGLVVALEPWQPASRLHFLREQGSALDADIAAWLAEHLVGGGRQLDGALHQLAHLQHLLERPLTLVEVVAHFAPSDGGGLTLERIAAHVGRHFRVGVSRLRSADRSRGILWPRQVGMYLARQLTSLALTGIGDYFGRDPATVRHACQKVADEMRRDPAHAATVRRLLAELA